MLKFIVLVMTVLLANNQLVYALQVKQIKDNQTLFAKISSKELTRIFVKNDRIQSVRGIDGAYQLTKDEIQGAVFIKPSLFYQHRAFNLFIGTEQGHSYTLLLSPIDIPAENIELKSLSPSKILAERWEKNSPYSDIIIQLMHAMENSENPEGYAVIPLGKVKPKRLDSGLTMQLVTFYQGARLQGEIWLIKNTCCRTAHLSPRNFYQDNVRAISLKDENLDKNEETYLYKVVDHD